MHRKTRISSKGVPAVRIWNCFAVAAWVCLVGVSAMAQNGAPAAGGAAAPQAAPAAAAWPVARIALIDIGHIFRNHPTMKSEQEAVESLAKSYQEELTKKRQELVKQFEALKQFKDDSLEFKQGEEKLAEAEAALQLDMGRKEKELVEKRAEVFYKNYQQVHTMVKWLAESQGIDMVITFNREEMDPKAPATVQRGLAKSVLYHSGNVDLTDWVLNNLKQQSAQAPAAQTAKAPAAAAGATGTRRQ
jgi:Skp family chaperone for outer membrane proteins